MEYLIEHLAALSLEERLHFIERIITAIDCADYFSLIREQLEKQNALIDKDQNIDVSGKNPADR